MRAIQELHRPAKIRNNKAGVYSCSIASGIDESRVLGFERDVVAVDGGVV
jgi:hypothetical protein